MDLLILSSLFFAGALSESLLRVRVRDDLVAFVVCLILPLLLFSPVTDTTRTAVELEGNVILSVGFYCFVFTCVFKEKLLRVIDERILLHYTLILLYVAWTNAKLTPDGFFDNVKTLLLGPAVVVFILVFTRFSTPKPLRLLLYVWFLLASFLCICGFYSIGALTSALKSPISIETALTCLCSGFVFFHLIGNLSYLLELIPVPAKGQSGEDRIREVRAYIELLVSRYDDVQLSFRAAALNFSALLATLGLNYFLVLIPHEFMMTVALMVVTAIDLALEKRLAESVQSEPRA